MAGNPKTPSGSADVPDEPTGSGIGYARGRKRKVRLPPVHEPVQPTQGRRDAVYRRPRPLDERCAVDVEQQLRNFEPEYTHRVLVQQDAENPGYPMLHIDGSAPGYSLEAAIRIEDGKRMLDVISLEFTDAPGSVTAGLGAAELERCRLAVIDALLRVTTELNGHSEVEQTQVRVRSLSGAAGSLWSKRGIDVGTELVDETTRRKYYGRKRRPLDDAEKKKLLDAEGKPASDVKWDAFKLGE